MTDLEIARDKWLGWIKENVPGVTCSLGFKCASGGFENLCKVQSTVTEGVLVCLTDNGSGAQKDCPFAEGRGRDPRHPHVYLCRCPVRLKIYQKFQK